MQIDKDMIFVDLMSGFKKGEVRPEYSRLMERVNQGQVSTLLFSEMNRHSRSCVELLSHIARDKSRSSVIIRWFNFLLLNLCPHRFYRFVRLLRDADLVVILRDLSCGLRALFDVNGLIL